MCNIWHWNDSSWCPGTKIVISGANLGPPIDVVAVAMTETVRSEAFFIGFCIQGSLCQVLANQTLTWNYCQIKKQLCEDLPYQYMHPATLQNEKGCWLQLHYYLQHARHRYEGWSFFTGTLGDGYIFYIFVSMPVWPSPLVASSQVLFTIMELSPPPSMPEVKVQVNAKTLTNSNSWGLPKHRHIFNFPVFCCCHDSNGFCLAFRACLDAPLAASQGAFFDHGNIITQLLNIASLYATG